MHATICSSVFFLERLAEITEVGRYRKPRDCSGLGGGTGMEIHIEGKNLSCKINSPGRCCCGPIPSWIWKVGW